MVNTNGIRIAQDEAFAKRLADYMPDFEVYLQFDSFERRRAAWRCAGPTCATSHRARSSG